MRNLTVWRLIACVALLSGPAHAASATEILIGDANSSPENMTAAPGGILIVGSSPSPFIYIPTTVIAESPCRSQVGKQASRLAPKTNALSRGKPNPTKRYRQGIFSTNSIENQPALVAPTDIPKNVA